MKFYNPFKPHIVFDGRMYAIRKYVILVGWKYFDINRKDYWWIRNFDLTYSWSSNKKQVKEIFDEMNNCPIEYKRSKENIVGDVNDLG